MSEPGEPILSNVARALSTSISSRSAAEEEEEDEWDRVYTDEEEELSSFGEAEFVWDCTKKCRSERMEGEDGSPGPGDEDPPSLEYEMLCGAL